MRKVNIPSAAEIQIALQAFSYAQMRDLSERSGVPFTTLWKVRGEETNNPRIESVRAFWPHVLDMQRQAKASA